MILEGSSFEGMADYLPLAGPRPLRFAEPPVAPNLSLLPPLPMNDRPRAGHGPSKANELAEETEDSDSPKPELPDPGPINVPPSGYQVQPTQPPEIITTTHSSPPTENPLSVLKSLEEPREPLLSPQMLVPFFQPTLGTNRLSVTLPLIFSPAGPPASTSSSATYEKR